MTTIQEQLIGMIQEIDTLCRKYDIPYYLSGGSVIGAIRHKGFIPWDDDIDILLDSKYWDKFYHAFQEEMPQYRFLGCVENNENFPNMVNRYCDVTTTQIHKNELFGDSTAGVVVDIILLDSIPEGTGAWNEHMKNMLLYSDLVNVYYAYSQRFDIHVPYGRYLFLSKLFGKKKILMDLDKKIRQYENQECDFYVVRWPAGPNVFPKSMFGTPKYIEFEGISLPIPAKSGDFLRELYGDEWVEVPEPQEQNPHDTITDFNRGYDEYFKQYVSRIGYEKTVKRYAKIKKHYIKTKKIQSENGKTLWTIEGLKEKYLINKRIEQENLNPFDMLKRGEYEELLSLFGEYMLRQGSSDYLGTEFWGGLIRRYDPVYVDLGDDMFSIVLWLWLYQGRLSKACKVLRARNMCRKEEAAGALKEAEIFISDMRNAISLYEQKEYDSSYLLVLDLLNRAVCPIVNLWKLLIRLERILQCGSWEREQSWIEACLLYKPEDGELLKYRTDKVYAEKGMKDAYKDYFYAYQHTRNGIIWLEIGDIFKKELSWALNRLALLLDSGEYAEALELADIWLKFEKDSKRLEYVKCFCMSHMENVSAAEKHILTCISKYPDELQFIELLKYIRDMQEKNTDYLEYEIRIQQTKDREEYKKIKKDLLHDSGNGDSFSKMELQARLCRLLGEKEEEFALYRNLFSQGYVSDFMKKVISSDMKKMITALRNAKTLMLRQHLLVEWCMKYPDMEENVALSICCGLLPEALGDTAGIWMQEIRENTDTFETNINELYNAIRR